MYSSDPAGHRDTLNVIVNVRCPSAARTRASPMGSRRGARSAPCAVDADAGEHQTDGTNNNEGSR
jgi:hypothetical protein